MAWTAGVLVGSEVKLIFEVPVLDGLVDVWWDMFLFDLACDDMPRNFLGTRAPKSPLGPKVRWSDLVAGPDIE